MRKSYLIAAVKAVSVFFLLIGALSQAQAQPGGGEQEGWEFTVGAGMLAMPNYVGDDDYQLILAPSISATDGDHWAISFRQGLQYTVNPQNDLRWGVSVAPSMGRDPDGDNPLRIAGDGTDDLIGFDDEDAAVALRLFSEYEISDWRLSAELEHAFTDEPKAALKLGLGRSWMVKTPGPPLILVGGIRARAGDQQTLQSLVGVRDDQTAATGLDAFRPDGGVIGYGFNATAILPLSRQLSVIANFSIEQLSEEMKQSSLISERGESRQMIFGIFLNYKIKPGQAGERN